jgi:glucose-6-phosphate isomerase/transaldolase/glucose-6-phosphate isomerase
VEQLISESLGKEGKGIIPILGEPLIEPSDYSCDRFFICLRLHGDDNSTLDSVINRIKASGQPTLVLEMHDKYDLGAELFRWEYAVAVAGAIIGIHPFDQPNVQSAKDATKQALKDYTTSGYLPQIKTGSSLVDLLAKAEKGEYFAITAYLRQTPELDNVFTKIRRQVLDRFHIATTVGYGPRYLHSTGQLHKGGPNTGLYLQITANHEKDISIPGQPYTFGVVADAQALGDLRALQSMGRRVVKVHLSQPDPAAIEANVRVD